MGLAPLISVPEIASRWSARKHITNVVWSHSGQIAKDEVDLTETRMRRESHKFAVRAFRRPTPNLRVRKRNGLRPSMVNSISTTRPSFTALIFDTRQPSRIGIEPVVSFI